MTSQIVAHRHEKIIEARGQWVIHGAGRYVHIKDSDGLVILKYDGGGSVELEGSMGHEPETPFKSITLENPSDDPVTVKLLISDGRIVDNRSSFSGSDPIPVQIQKEARAPVAKIKRLAANVNRGPKIEQWVGDWVTKSADNTHLVVNLAPGNNWHRYADGADFLEAKEGSEWFASFELKGVGSNVGKKVKALIKRSQGAYYDFNKTFSLSAGWQRVFLGPFVVGANSTGVLAALTDVVGGATQVLVRDVHLCANEFEPVGSICLRPIVNENAYRRHVDLQNTGSAAVWIWGRSGSDWVRLRWLQPFEAFRFEGRNALAFSSDEKAFVSAVEV